MVDLLKALVRGELAKGEASRSTIKAKSENGAKERRSENLNFSHEAKHSQSASYGWQGKREEKKEKPPEGKWQRSDSSQFKGSSGDSSSIIPLSEEELADF